MFFVTFFLLLFDIKHNCKCTVYVDANILFSAFKLDYFDSFLALQMEYLLVLSKQGFVP